jgi:hypothetical protein
MYFKTSNLGKPSNKRFKMIADFFLYSLPLYQTALVALPATAISEDKKMWIGFIFTMVVVTLKGLSKFTSENQEQDDTVV